jgi:hypothetical protein
VPAWPHSGVERPQGAAGYCSGDRHGPDRPPFDHTGEFDWSIVDPRSRSTTTSCWTRRSTGAAEEVNEELAAGIRGLQPRAPRTVRDRRVSRAHGAPPEGAQAGERRAAQAHRRQLCTFREARLTRMDYYPDFRAPGTLGLRRPRRGSAGSVRTRFGTSQRASRPDPFDSIRTGTVPYIRIRPDLAQFSVQWLRS